MRHEKNPIQVTEQSWRKYFRDAGCAADFCVGFDTVGQHDQFNLAHGDTEPDEDSRVLYCEQCNHSFFSVTDAWGSNV